MKNFLLRLRLFFTSNKAKDREIKRLKKELADKMQELEMRIENAESEEEKERLIMLNQKINVVGKDYRRKIKKLT